MSDSGPTSRIVAVWRSHTTSSKAVPIPLRNMLKSYWASQLPPMVTSMNRHFTHNSKTYKVISEWMDDTLKVVIHPDEADAKILYSIETTRDKLEEMKQKLAKAKHAHEAGFIDHAIEDFKSRHH